MNLYNDNNLLHLARARQAMHPNFRYKYILTMIFIYELKNIRKLKILFITVIISLGLIRICIAKSEKDFLDNKIIVYVKNINDANLKAYISFNFFIQKINFTSDELHFEMRNSWFKKNGEIIDGNTYSFKISDYKDININNQSSIFNKTITKNIKMFGDNIIYPYDNYMMNITFRINEINIFCEDKNPFDLRVWPGGWVQSNLDWDIKNYNDFSIVNLYFVLNRTSTDKAFFQWFYPLFFLLLGFISIIDVKKNTFKLAIYITLFLALSSTLIYFFPLLPPKSGSNCVIWITLILTVSIILFFARDIFFYKHNIIIYSKFTIPIIVSSLVLFYTVLYYLFLKTFNWIDWFYFWFNMSTIMICSLIPTLFDHIVNKYKSKKKYDVSNLLY